MGNRAEQSKRGRLEKRQRERQGETLSKRELQKSDESAMGGLWMKESKCAVERGGADEEEEEGRRWRGSSWGIESVSMLIALIWRG